MLFATVEYWIFFLFVAVVFYALPFRFGKVLLLLASYFFYMWWDVRFIVLILASTVIDYALGILLETSQAKRRKPLLVTSLIVNLGILGFFKYYNFFAGSVAAALRMSPDSLVLNIILPVGISFYTFASLSYTIDVYWGKIRAVRNFVDYAFFIAFFPHLIAGPIIRAKQFLPQIQRWRRPPDAVLQMGAILIFVGLIKKVVFADRFAAISDPYFGDLARHPGWLAAWSAAGAFSLQLFFDFSGYTDIARGCAKLLGFEFPLNFARPFLAVSVVQFWQRWHITLAAWVRDYLFVPFTRRSRSRLQIYFVLMWTMVLVGLWHGASWNFVVWGVYMGCVTIVYRVGEQLIRGSKAERFLRQRWLTPAKVLATFVCFVIGVVIFRATSLTDAFAVLHAMFDWKGAAGNSVLTNTAVALVFISFLLAVLEERGQVFERLAVAPSYVQVPVYLALLLSIELFSLAEAQAPFLYFQF